MATTARTRRIIEWSLLVSLLVSAALLFTAAIATASRANHAIAAYQSPAQATFLEFAVPDLVRRISIIENQSLDARVRVVENDVQELKYLSRGVALTVLGQLIVTGMGVMRKGRAS